MNADEGHEMTATAARSLSAQLKRRLVTPCELQPYPNLSSGAAPEWLCGLGGWEPQPCANLFKLASSLESAMCRIQPAMQRQKFLQ